MLALLAVALVFVALALFAVRGSMRASDVYLGALTARGHILHASRALANPSRPASCRGASAAISTDDGGSGHADLSFALSGPSGSARITATAQRVREVWIHDPLVFVPLRDRDGMLDPVDPGTPMRRGDRSTH